jgi:hypothetical protein
MVISFQNFISGDDDAAGKAVGQFLILETFSVAATAESYDHVHVVRRNVSATDITVVVTFSIKRANYIWRHDVLIDKIYLQSLGGGSSPAPLSGICYRNTNLLLY